MKTVGNFNFNFNGVNIPFEATLGNTSVMVNATEMAKSMSKTKMDYDRLRPSKWLITVDCNRYINALIKNGRISSINDVVKRVSIPGRRGRGQTWMEKKLAIRYAQWLDEDFAIWVDDRIDEILTNGYSFMTQENGNLQTIINQLQPKADYYDQVLQNSNFVYSTRDLCLSLGLNQKGITNKNLIKRLISESYGYRTLDGKFHLYEPYNSEGYLGTNTELCPDGKYRTSKKWSEYGRIWIYGLAKKWGIL